MTLNINYTRGHIPALDGLRGTAALAVIGFHIFSNHVKFGWIGVDLFFVLSGFLITGILLDSKGTVNYYRNYLAKRALRIFPLYYFFLIVFFGVFRWTGYGNSIDDYDYLSSIQSWYWLYIQNWRVFFDPLYPGEDIISHFWSLAIEEQFYIFWPIVIYLIPFRRVIPVCLALIGISIACRLYMYYVLEMSFIKVYFFTAGHLDVLAVGAILAAMVRNENLMALLAKYTLWIFIISGSAVLGIGVWNHSFGIQEFTPYGFTVLAIFFGSMIIVSLAPHRYNLLKFIMESRALTFFGKYSYGLYVYHIPVLRICMVELNGVVSRQMMLVIAFALSIVVAYISYHLIEKHFLKLKSRFTSMPRHEPEKV
ncbi:MAG TPA: acyltransferase [Ohtaekwangia sp.]